jgi:hypothetical protein
MSARGSPGSGFKSSDQTTSNKVLTLIARNLRYFRDRKIPPVKGYFL